MVSDHWTRPTRKWLHFRLEHCLLSTTAQDKPRRPRKHDYGIRVQRREYSFTPEIRDYLFYFELVPQDVDWDPVAALWGTPDDVLEAIVNNLDFIHPVSTHILQQMLGRGYSPCGAAGFCALENAQGAYVIATLLPQLRVFTLP